MDAKTVQTAATAAAAAFEVFKDASANKRRKRSRGPYMRGSIGRSGSVFKKRFLARTMMVPNRKKVQLHLNGNYVITAASGPGQYFDVIFNDLHGPMNTGSNVTTIASAVSGTPTVSTHGYYGLNQWLGAAKFYDSYRVLGAKLKLNVTVEHDYDTGEVVIIPLKRYQSASDTGLTTLRDAKDTGWSVSCPFTRGKICSITKSATVASLYGLDKKVVDSNEGFQARYGATPVNYALFRVFIQKAGGIAWSGNVPFQVTLTVDAELFNSDQGNIGSSVV